MVERPADQESRVRIRFLDQTQRQRQHKAMKNLLETATARVPSLEGAPPCNEDLQDMLIYVIYIGVMGFAGMVGYIYSGLNGEETGEMIFGPAFEGRKTLHGFQRSVNVTRVRNIRVVATLGSANLATFSLGMKLRLKLFPMFP